MLTFFPSRAALNCDLNKNNVPTNSSMVTKFKFLGRNILHFSFGLENTCVQFRIDVDILNLITKPSSARLIV